MSTSFQYEDPMNRANVNIGTMAQTRLAMKDMGKKMVSSGKGFGKVGAIYSGVECCVEGVSACLSFAPYAYGFLTHFRLDLFALPVPGKERHLQLALRRFHRGRHPCLPGRWWPSRRRRRWRGLCRVLGGHRPLHSQGDSVGSSSLFISLRESHADA
jgi:hypothetical protein